MTVEATVNANQLLAVLLHSVGDEERMESCLRLSPTGFFHHSFGREHRNLGGEARFCAATVQRANDHDSL